ncbi:Uncharacterised protein [Enterococcus hirae]|nr:Uncharacterised protein [Enterococcus hirae]
MNIQEKILPMKCPHCNIEFDPETVHQIFLI